MPDAPELNTDAARSGPGPGPGTGRGADRSRASVALTPKQPTSDLLVALGDEGAPVEMATPSRIAWRRFRKNRQGMIGLIILLVLYTVAAFAGFFAPYDYADEVRELPWAPPTGVHFSDANGFSWRPFVHPIRIDFDENFATVVKPDESRRCYLRFFVRAAPYKLFGVIPGRTRLLGVDPLPDGTVASGTYYSRLYLMGADGSGRDIFSRICYGSRISMTIGLIGALLVLVIGLAVGGTSGYAGGWVDDVLQRLCEMVMLLPGFYLLLMLRFMFPASMDSTKLYFAVVLILSLVGWAAFARVIRGMVLSIRKEDYVQAARAMGLSHPRIIAKHILPNTMGYVVVATTLRIPGYILGESALSLLGLGIMEPTPSWGNMLQKAMDILELNQHPWVLWPGVFIFLAIMAFNLVGDGLRDAVDPRGLATR